jgi:predicted GH43/DUF377 family glycosyl hydrolase
MKKIHSLLLLVLIGISASSLLLYWRLDKRVYKIARQSRALYGEFILAEAEEEERIENASFYEKRPLLSPSLSKIPYGEDLGIITSVKKVEINGAFAPYNASIVEDGSGGYLMVFRYDIKERKKIVGIKTPFRKKILFGNKKMPFRTYIGAVRLDKDFVQVSPVQTIDTGSDFSEDPRIFTAGGKFYISYNDMLDNPVYIRSMRLACIDPTTLTTLSIVDVDQQISFIDRTSHVEKNWTPFVSAEENDRICFGYSINPHKILKMKSPESGEMDHPIYPHTVAFQKMLWKEKQWGTLRGGTPARLVNGQYLAFFHTLFFENGRPWYIMGAYTFEATAPYRVTAVSPAPILFKGIYESKTKNTAHSKKRALFPAGIALGEENGRDVVYVSCGENDCEVKIITFDQEALLKSLEPIKPYLPQSKNFFSGK